MIILIVKRHKHILTLISDSVFATQTINSIMVALIIIKMGRPRIFISVIIV